MVRQRLGSAAPRTEASGKVAAASRPQDCEVCVTPVSDGRHIVSALRLAGHAVTPPREAVIRAVAAQPRPFTAGALCAAVAARDPSVGRATVFRTLELLAEAGVLDRLHAVRGDASYVARDPDRPNRPHQYLVCTVCDGVTELEDPKLAALLRNAAAARAFRPEGALVEILGRCQAC